MISRHQRIVFWCLVGCILAMGTLLFVERQRARDRIVALADATPLDAPYSTTESVTLDLANDSDGSITATTRPIALPGEVTARARALLEHLLAEYALPGSPHPLQSGAAVDEVFLLPLPLVGHSGGSAAATSSLVASNDSKALQPQNPGGELAVINLRSSFVDAHPSGVEVESLTLMSIIGTLHTNLPQIEQIRFLVDGQPRETLAGHADLLRTYPAKDTTARAETSVAP